MIRGIYWDEQLETMPWADVQAWQAPRVAAFVEALPTRSSFYKEHLDSATRPRHDPKSLGFLADLGFVTKDDVRRSQDEGGSGEPLGAHQSVPLVEIVQTVSSSGTTGHPTYYGLTPADVDAWRDAVACVFWTTGIRPHDVVAHLVALPGVAGGLPYADGFRHLGATLAWLGGFPTERQLASVSRLGVTAMLSTASFGIYLTDNCEQLAGRPARELGVRKLLAGGEAGLGNTEIRAKITDGWGLSHLSEIMGLGDVVSALWGECDDGSGMHFCGQGHVAVELIDPATGDVLRWEEGASGEAVYTTFDRQATPMLRFRSRDHIVVTGVSCRCGRTSPKIRCVGRTDDMLIYKAMNVFPGAIRDVALQRGGDALAPYLRVWKDTADQVRFDDPIPVEIEAAEGTDPRHYPELARQLEAEVRARLQIRTAMSVVAPGTLPRSAYKTPLVHVRGQ